MDEERTRPPPDPASRRLEDLARLIDTLRRVQRRGTIDDVRRTVRDLVEWFTDRGPGGPGPPTRA